MNQDLKIIKKKYGEEMMHLCRTLFPTILEQEGLLPKLLHDNFKESRSLSKDIISHKLEAAFKNYIYSFINKDDKEQVKTDKTPEELLKEVGYNLYECHNEEEIQSFKEYYENGEELCTFAGNRLNRCYVFFAVKDNVDDIKRKDFPNPKRQDSYGTSVISIQFEKDETHTLSIKNRYNHSVNNPDSTFSNNLDNIIPGLTYSFDKCYGMHQTNVQGDFEIPGYVRANDGKYYKYNYEINNIYYCENNVIIDNFNVREYPKEEYLVFDYFILDLKNKKIETYYGDLNIEDSFPKTFGTIKDIKIEKKGNTKEVLVKTKYSKDYDIKITLDKNNKMLSLVNKRVEKLDDNFLYYNETLKEISLPKVKRVGNNCLRSNKDLMRIDMEEVRVIKDYFCSSNNTIDSISFPNLKHIGNSFFEANEKISFLNMENVKDIGNKFMIFNKILSEIYLPNVKRIGDEFMPQNQGLTELYFPSLVDAGHFFLCYNENIKVLDFPRLRNASVGTFFCNACKNAKIVNIPLSKELETALIDRSEHDLEERKYA